MTEFRSATEHVQSFYHLPEGIGQKLHCNGLSCFVARKLDPERWSGACLQKERIYCLGKCYAAPASVEDKHRPAMKCFASEPIVLKGILDGGRAELGQYVSSGGYEALRKARGISAEEIIRELERSGLRGRGGAGFPTGRKWRAVYSQASDRKFVIANGDEGDPGAFIDRLILEEDPHCLIESLAIAAHAIDAKKGFIYIRNEYPDAIRSVQHAIDQAAEAGILNDLSLELVRGKGSYVCGEETALINSIEGHRGEPKLRPPFPHEAGLYGKPTLVNNIETLANIPWIIKNGGDPYHALGFSNSRGTKLISLNSLFNTPGLYEVEFGISVRAIVEEIGGGLRTGALKGVLVGGPLAGVIPPDLLDTKFGFEELASIGAAVGHGGIVAFNDSTSVVDLMHHVFEFGAFESCGKCIPCRAGTQRIHEIFDEILTCGMASIQKKQEVQEIISLMRGFSFCGFGTGLADFAASILKYYEKELGQCFL